MVRWEPRGSEDMKRKPLHNEFCLVAAVAVVPLLLLPASTVMADDDDQSRESVELDNLQVGSPGSDDGLEMEGLGDQEMGIDRDSLGMDEDSGSGFGLDPDYGSPGMDIEIESSFGEDAEDREVIEEDSEIQGAGEVDNQDLEPVSIGAPEYPRSAYRDRREGSVQVEFTVDGNGETTDIEVVDAEPRGVFEDAAIEAVEEWRFQPQITEGRPQEVRLRQSVDFTLD